MGVILMWIKPSLLTDERKQKLKQKKKRMKTKEKDNKKKEKETERPSCPDILVRSSSSF